jgi:hypothetical protein
MMLVPAPEPAAWVSLPETGEGFKHFLSSVGFEHDLGGLDGVLLRYVHQEVDMVECKTEFSKLKTELFQVVERLKQNVDVDLFSKTVIPVVGDEHHGHPVIASVTRNLFRATANYIFHIEIFSCRTFRGQANACRVRQKKISFVWRKKGCDFSSAGHHCGSDHAVFPVATISEKPKRNP